MYQRIQAVLGLVVGVVSLSATAQTAVIEAPAEAPPPLPAAPAKAPPASRMMEEVIITAQKREENLQDVPISVQAFSAEALDARGINTAVDLPLVTPGLTYNSLAGYSIIYLRGIGTDAFIPSADLSIATYVDGVYFPASFGLLQDFGALERIEVLKGPQGTLFGRNSTGGAISITTKAPSQTQETSLEAGIGSFNAYRGRAYTNVPLADNLAVNVSLVYSFADSYYNSPTVPLADEISRGARIKLGWEPLDDVKITLTTLLARQQGSSSLIANNLSPKPLLDPFKLPPYNVKPQTGYTLYNDSVPETSSQTNAYYGQAVWSPEWFDVKFIGARQKVNVVSRIDFDGTAVPLAVFEGQSGSAKIDTAELQLLSNKSSYASDWLTSIAGLYYIHSFGGFNPVYLRPGPLLPAPLQSVFTTLLGGPILEDGARIKIYGLIDTKATAGFFQSTAKATDWFSLTLGGRYQSETRKLTRATVGLDIPDTPDLVTYAPRQTSTSNFSPKVSLDFRPLEDTLVYLSYSKGFKSGTYNIINIDTPPDYVKPETVSAYELGLKTELFDHNLRFNAALFDSKIKDLQVQIVSLQSGGAVSFENAGSAEIKGAEFDTLWVPLPSALPGLVFTASGTYLNSEYTNFPNGSGYDVDTGIYFGQSSALPGRNFAGNQIARAPKFSAATSLSYTYHLAYSSIEVAGDYYYNSGYYFSAQNSPRSEQKSYGVVNARTSYFYEPWQMRLTVYGRNLTGTRYYLTQFESDFGTLGQLQAPVNYGMRVNWDF